MTNPVIVTQDKMAGASNEPAALPPSSDKRMQLFSQLKPYTSQLLRARDSPARLQSLLVRLQNVIRDADPDGLNSRGILDYILFPLMPGVDSVVLMRRPGQAHACEYWSTLISMCFFACYLSKPADAAHVYQSCSPDSCA